MKRWSVFLFAAALNAAVITTVECPSAVTVNLDGKQCGALGPNPGHFALVKADDHGGDVYVWAANFQVPFDPFDISASAVETDALFYAGSGTATLRIAYQITSTGHDGPPSASLRVGNVTHTVDYCCLLPFPVLRTVDFQIQLGQSQEMEWSVTTGMHIVTAEGGPSRGGSFRIMSTTLLDAVAVPEPGTITLVAIGLACSFRLRRGRSSSPPDNAV
jgi:hypothetical protein